jgi:gliding motility-associated-like protein
MSKTETYTINIKRIILFISTLFLCCWCKAQLCTGSLGDPVVDITFGSGPNPGKPLNAATTSYQYTSDIVPSDGYYTVRNNIIRDDGSWHLLTSDHTGDKNGYFMLVNASFDPSDFYLDTVHGLCGNTTYEFAAWIINLLKPNTFCGPTGIMPNITFTIEKLDGHILKSFNTGDIQPTDSILWTQYGFSFTTQPNLNDVVIRMRNNGPGGCGNDLALDDITFRPCGPLVNISIMGSLNSKLHLCKTNAVQKVTLNGSLSQGFDDPGFQWQQSVDSGKTWIDIAGENSSGHDVFINNATASGLYLFRLGVGESDNIESVPCRVVSNVDTISVGTIPSLTITNNSPQCADSAVIFTVKGAAIYQWTGPNNFSSVSDSIAIVNAQTINAGKYYVKASSIDGCSVNDSTNVIIKTVTASVGKDTSICIGGAAQLHAGGGDTYNWQANPTLSATNISNPIAKPTDATQYIVTVTKNGCPANDTVMVNVVQKMVVGSNSPICAGADLLLNATMAKNYSWSGPNGFTSTDSSVKITTATFINAGKYYVNDPSDKVCFNKDSVTVVVNDPKANAGADTSMCAGSGVQLNGSGNGSFAWSPSTGLSSTVIANPVAMPSATTKYILSVSLNSCIATDTVLVTVFDKVIAQKNTPVCTGSTIALSAGNANAYQWTGPDNFSATGASVNISNAAVANAGWYYVTDPSNKICTSIDSTEITVINPVADAGNDTTVCEGATVQLNGSGNGSFVWSPSAGLSSSIIADPSFTAKQSQQYTLSVQQQNCTASATVNIKVLPLPVVNAGADKTIMNGQSTILNGYVNDTSVNYYWTPDLYMTDAHVLQPTVQPPTDITYTLHAESNAGCGTATDDVFVKVYQKVLVPNAFSPNGDGVHDVWQIEALAAYTDADVSVFNRYGQLVFHSIGYNRPWDGTYNNKPVPLATYYYVIDLKNNTPKLSGWVVILR